MKKLFLLIIFAFAIISCSKPDPIYPFSYGETLPVESVVMPTVYGVNIVSNITVRYKKPTTCYDFDGFYYQKSGNVRTVGVNLYQYYGNGCQADTQNTYEASLNFRPTISGTYTFKFWTGKDVSGINQYIIETVVVP